MLQVFANYQLWVVALDKQSAPNRAKDLASSYLMKHFRGIPRQSTRHSDCKHPTIFINVFPDISVFPNFGRSRVKFGESRGECV